MIVKQRNLYYDILRVFATFCVIGVHSLGSIIKFTSGHVLFITLLKTINELGVPIFFSLSGYFLFNENIDDILFWYKKRVKRLLLPFLIYAILYVCYFVGYEQKNYVGIPLEYFLALLFGNTHPTHWFVFTIIGLTFATPFLKKMFDATSNFQFLLFYVFLLFFTFVNSILSIFNLKLGINTLVFDNYFVILYISGYCINKCNTIGFFKIMIKYKYAIILLFFIIKVLYQSFIFSNIIISSLLLVEDKKISQFFCPINKIFEFIARYSYSIYLIHAAVVSLVLMIYKDFGEFFIIKTFCLYITVYIISQIIVIIVNQVLYLLFKLEL